MTYKQKYNENKSLIAKYDSFLQSDVALSFEHRMKLINEIARLSIQNETIGTMPVKVFETDSHDYSILQKSAL